MAGLILVGAEKMGKDEPKESNGKKVIFDTPEGFEFPEDRTKTEVLAEIKKDKDGKICLLSIDGYALPYSDNESEEEVEETEEDLDSVENIDEAFASDEEGY